MMLTQPPKRNHIASYAPMVPSPLNPQPSTKRLSTRSSPTYSSPKPQVRRKSSRNVSPTQRLLRQKAQVAWRSQTRYNTILSSPEETSFSAVHSSLPGAEGQFNQREGDNQDDTSVYKDISLHPNMVALIENLAKENPVIVSATANPYASPGPLEFDTDFGLPTWRQEVCDNEKRRENDAANTSQTASHMGLGINFPLFSFTSHFNSQKVDNFDEKNALISELPPPRNLIMEYECEQRSGTVGYSSIEESLVPLLPLHNAHLQAPIRERTRNATAHRIFFLITTLAALLCIYPVVYMLLPRISSGFEFL